MSAFIGSGVRTGRSTLIAAAATSCSSGAYDGAYDDLITPARRRRGGEVAGCPGHHAFVAVGRLAGWQADEPDGLLVPILSAGSSRLLMPARRSGEGCR
jgi:hypothetical protein